MKRLIIIGAGGYGITVADLAEQSGDFSAVKFLDDMKKDENVLSVCADFEKFADGNTVFYPAFGNNELRLDWLDKISSLGLEIPTIIHPRAYVSPKAQIGYGTVVLPGAVVNTDCLVERGGIININAVIDHGCVIEEGCHICINAVVKAENRIAARTKIDAGQVIENRTYKV